MNWNTGSLEEQVGRWEDQRDIKNLMGIYVNHIIMNMDAEIFDALWSSRDDVCYGDNDGWYVGPDAVRGYYQAVRARNALVAELLQRKFPQEIGQRTAEENFGIGTFRDFPVACPVIEVAEDGETAKGLWYCWGSQAQVLSCGPTASWTWATTPPTSSGRGTAGRSGICRSPTTWTPAAAPTGASLPSRCPSCRSLPL